MTDHAMMPRTLEDTMTHSAQITNAGDALQFVLGGNATFTLVSVASGTRYTYQVKAPWDGAKFELDNPRRFVRYRTGSDDWTYLGFFYEDRLNAGKKGQPRNKAFRALAWLMAGLTTIANDPDADQTLPADKIEFWHEGHCARCGRQLTVPASIERGFGPDCAAAIGMTI